MISNQVNLANMERYENYIINPQIIAGSICRRGVILRGPDVPTVILAIRFTTNETADSFAREGQVYKFLRINPSPFVAHIIADHIITTNNQPSGRIIIMPAANGNNLQTVLNTCGTMPLHLACRMLVQITAGINHCHNHNIVLRDITVGHIFFSEPTRRTAILADLSKSQLMPPNSGKAWLLDKCGTLSYAAPEILTYYAYDGFAADIYALGVVFFVSIFGYFPFVAATPGALYTLIVNGQINFPAGVPVPIINLLRSMMARNPNNRPTANAILSLPWLAPIVANNNINVVPIPAEQIQQNNEVNNSIVAVNNNHEFVDKDPSVGN